MASRWPVSQFHCRRCGARVSAPVEEVLLAEPVFFGPDSEPLDPRFEFRCSPDLGTLWRAPDDLLGHDLDLCVHPDSAFDVTPCGDWSGCCGVSGTGEPNLACPAGHPVARRVNDCATPDVVAFARERVDERPAPTRPFSGRVVVIGEPPLTRVEQLVAALHACLGATAWHGDEFESLVLDHTTSPGEPVCIYWADAEVSRRAGLPVARALAAFVRARRTHLGLAALVPK